MITPKLKLKTTCYVKLDFYGRVVDTFRRTEPRKLRALGYVWRATARGVNGDLIYTRAEAISCGRNA